MQYLFLNQRYIRDRSLQHALSEAYRGLLMTGRFPICFLQLEMPFELVDVNVHPAKLEVRFQNGGKIYSQLLSTIRNRFLSTDLTAYAQLSKREIPAFQPHPDSAPARLPATPANQERIPFAAPASQLMTGLRLRVNHCQPGNQPIPAAESSFELAALARSDLETVISRQRDSPRGGRVHRTAAPRRTVSAFQVHNTYLIQETEEGMVVIDQHALHERIIYEQLRDKGAWLANLNRKNYGPRTCPVAAGRSSRGIGTSRYAGANRDRTSNRLVATRCWLPLILRCWPTIIRPRCSRALSIS